MLALISVSAVLAFQASSIPASGLISPEELVKILQSTKGEKPLMIQVGSHVLYEQAHIPVPSTSALLLSESGIQQLRKRVQASAPTQVHRYLLRMLPMEPLSERQASRRRIACDGFYQRESALYSRQFWRELGG